MNKKGVRFDPRTKLVLILFANWLLLAHVTFTIELLGMAVFACVFILMGRWKKAVMYVLLFSFAIYLDELIIEQFQESYWRILGIFAVGIRRFLPTIMAGSISLSSTKTSEWIVAMKKMKIPMEIVIPMTVLFRFFPTVIEDYRHIRNAMKLRGIGVTNWSIVKRPFQFLENILVPLLMSATNTAVDLSASALSRGISSPGKHTSYTKIGFHLQDCFLIVCLVGILFFNWGSDLV